MLAYTSSVDLLCRSLLDWLDKDEEFRHGLQRDWGNAAKQLCGRLSLAQIMCLPGRRYTARAPGFELRPGIAPARQSC